MIDQAGVFDGNDFINVNSIDLSNSFTIATWVWIDSTATNIQAIMANSAGGSTTAGFRFFVNSYQTADRKVIFEAGNGTTGNPASTGTGAVTLNAWNHIAAVVDRNAGTALIYVNGTNVTADNTIVTGFTVNATAHLGQFTDNGFRLHGRLDDMRTYNRQLAPSEISDLVNVAHHWPLDGDFTDIGGSNNGVNSGTTFTNAARVGTQAAVFDGNDFASVGAINLGNAFTLASWVWVDTGSTNIQTIMANASGGGNSNGFRFFINNYNTADGAVVFEAGNGTANDNARTGGGVIATGAWSHVAVTIDRAAGTASIYVNGTNMTSDGTVLTSFNNNTNVQLGQMTNSAFRLHGRLDDVRVYNKVLSANDIANLLNNVPNSLPAISSFTSSANPAQVNMPVTLTLNATDANNDALSYSFDFGDGGGFGTFSLNKSASHTYTSAGRYQVSGRVKDAIGMVTTSIVEIIRLPLTATNAVASSQIIYDASRNKVWNVNPDSDTVTRIDANALTKDFEIAVGFEPRSLTLRPNNAEVWVTCENSDQISILSATNGTVLQTLSTPRGSRPMGIVFSPDGAAAYVTYMNSGLLAKWNPTTRALIGTLGIGPTPRGMAISGDSARIFVGRFISPVNTATPSAEVGEVREVSASTFTVTRTFTVAHDATADTESSGRGTPNYLLQMAITPDGQRLFVPSKKDNVDRGTFRDGNALTHDNSVRAIFSKLDLVSNTEAVGERVDVDNHSIPHGVVFSPAGDLAFIAFQGNNEVVIFNAYNGGTITGIPLGNELSPQDLVMKPDGSRLFVLNFMTRSVSAFNITNIINGTSSSATQLAVIPTVTAEKLSAQVLQGKQIFYNAADTRMSAEGYISCASCHLDGGSDQRVWDFTDRGEGFRNTITLEGRRGTGHGNAHWTANFDEIQDFELDIRNAFAGTGFITNGAPNISLGAPNAGRSAELDALAAYVASLSKFKCSPFRNSDGTLTPDAVIGRQLFNQQNCVSCHSGGNFTDSVDSTNNFVLHNVGTLKAWSGQRLGTNLTGLDTPTLKGLWNTGPYLHDGTAATLLDVITTQNTNNQHGATSSLTATQQVQLVAYLQQIDDLEIGGETHLWPLDGNVNDVIGTNNGVNTGVTFTNAAKLGSAGVFDGADLINVNTIDLGNSFTLAVWVWIDATATNIQSIMANSAGGFTTNGFRWYVNSFNTADRSVLVETGNGAVGNSAKTSAGVVSLSAWNHLALVVNRTAGTANIFVNGTNYTTDATVQTDFNVNAPLHFGEMNNGVFRLHGRLDEVATFNRALSSNEIAILVNGDGAVLNGLSGGQGGFTNPGGIDGPQLRTFVNGDTMTISWLTSSGFKLETSPSLGVDADWQPVTLPVMIENGTARVTIVISADRQFFRLKK
jgi:DNA-binding beta-propeller fold protein YncE